MGAVPVSGDVDKEEKERHTFKEGLGDSLSTMTTHSTGASSGGNLDDETSLATVDIPIQTTLQRQDAAGTSLPPGAYAFPGPRAPTCDDLERTRTVPIPSTSFNRAGAQGPLIEATLVEDSEAPSTVTAVTTVAPNSTLTVAHAQPLDEKDTAYPEEPPPKPKRIRLRLLLAGMMVCLIVGGAIGAYVTLEEDDRQNPNESNSGSVHREDDDGSQIS